MPILATILSVHYPTRKGTVLCLEREWIVGLIKFKTGEPHCLETVGLRRNNSRENAVRQTLRQYWSPGREAHSEPP